MKKCPFCAESIQDEAIVCHYCGRDLNAIPKPIIEAKKGTMEVKKRKVKSPAVAVLLNAFPLILGLGYIYLGKWGRFFIVIGIQLFSLIPMSMLGLREYNVYILALVWMASIIDVYSQTNTYNKQVIA